MTSSSAAESFLDLLLAGVGAGSVIVSKVKVKVKVMYMYMAASPSSKLRHNQEQTRAKQTTSVWNITSSCSHSLCRRLVHHFWMEFGQY